MSSEHEPLSWLTLERYALGELSASERAEVEARLAASEADRACLATILEDKGELPPLPSKLPSATSKLPVISLPARAPARAVRHKTWLALGAGMCAAAAALLVVMRRPQQSELELSPTAGIKGDDVVLRLIGERQGSEPRGFGAGERFTLEVTCPPKLGRALRLLVFQGREVFEPLPTPDIACGNLVRWPGAFALDGAEPASVCLYWGEEQTPSRQALGPASACVELASF